MRKPAQCFSLLKGGFSCTVAGLNGIYVYGIDSLSTCNTVGISLFPKSFSFKHFKFFLFYTFFFNIYSFSLVDHCGTNGVSDNGSINSIFQHYCKTQDRICTGGLNKNYSVKNEGNRVEIETEREQGMAVDDTFPERS